MLFKMLENIANIFYFLKYVLQMWNQYVFSLYRCTNKIYAFLFAFCQQLDLIWGLDKVFLFAEQGVCPIRNYQRRMVLLAFH